MAGTFALSEQTHHFILLKFLPQILFISKIDSINLNLQIAEIRAIRGLSF